MKPNSRWGGFLEYKPPWLAVDRDRMDRSGIADPSGASGSFIGHQIQLQSSHLIVPSAIRLDFGGALRLQGEFLEDAPIAPLATLTHRVRKWGICLDVLMPAGS